MDPYKFSESNLELIGYLHDDKNTLQLIDGGNGAKLSRTTVLREAQSVCDKLQTLGHQKGDCVVVMGNNTVDYVLSFLGILLAEGVVCPQAITKPKHECDYILQDAGAVLVLGPATGAEPSMAAAKACEIPYVVTEFVDPLGAQNFELRPEEGSRAQRVEGNDPRRRGVLLYTSGTTGQPKGVPEPPRVMAKRLDIWRDMFDCTSKDSMALVAPVASATGLLSTLLPLRCGATLHLPGGGKFSARKFWKESKEYGVTQAVAVPTMLKLLIANAATDYSKADPPPLRRFYSIGAALSATLHQQMADTFGLAVFELYGMSELAVVSYNDPLNAKRARPGSAGVPLPGYDIAIFNPDGKPVEKKGDAGELCVKGELGFQGYHLKPEADDASYIDGWFHTGDGAYIDDDGFLQVTGRIKELISCGAIKYSPDEVDSVLQKHPDVAEAATFPIPEPMMGQVPESVVVLTNEHKVAVEDAPKEIRKYAADNLQDYKVPTKVHIVDAIPKSDAAKVQRYQLTKQYTREANGNQGEAFTSEAILQHVQEAWGQELGSAPESLTANFFGSGGGSMQAAALAGNLSDRLSRPIDSGLVFSDPEPGKLADAIAKQLNDGESKPAEEKSSKPVELKALSAEERAAGVPMARSWRANYFGISAGTGSNYIGVATELTGPLDVDALKSAHLRLLQRHESMRTVMKPQPGASVPLLDIVPTSQAEKLQWFKVSEASTEDEAVEIAKYAWTSPYDQEKGPMTRLQVIKLGPQKNWILIPVHHGIADQMGTLIVQKDLAALYNAAVDGDQPELSHLPVQDSDYMAFLTKQDAAGDFDESKAYWKEQFSSSESTLQEPVQKEGPNAGPNTIDAETLPIVISAKTLENIRNVAKQYQSSIMTVILAAYAEAAAEALSKKGALASIVTSGRSHPSIQDMVCSITTPLPVGMSAAGQGKLGALLEQANHQFAGAMQHSIPYQLLQEAAGDRAASLPFLTMNADLEMTKSALTLKSIKATPLDAQRFAGLYAKSAMIAYRRVLLFFRANQDDGLTGGLAWNPEFLDQAQGESIVSKLKVLLDSEWK